MRNILQEKLLKLIYETKIHEVLMFHEKSPNLKLLRRLSQCELNPKPVSAFTKDDFLSENDFFSKR